VFVESHINWKVHYIILAVGNLSNSYSSGNIVSRSGLFDRFAARHGMLRVTSLVDLCLSTSRMAFTDIKSNLCRENVVIPFLRVTRLRATIKGADLT